MRAIHNQTIVALILSVLTCTPGWAKQTTGDVYKGLEYFGSSQLTTMELEKLLALKPGASLSQVQAALDRLDKTLDARHMPNNLEVVAGEPGSAYVVVDIIDSSTTTVPTRKLKNPRHVLVRSEKPFLVYDELTKRLEQLNTENRPWTESYVNGEKTYSDEPANQLVEQIKRFAPDMKGELLAVVESEPDATRRFKAVELLGWSGDIPYVANRLTDAFDDSDAKVRVAAIKYVFPRLSMLPEEYPWIRIIQAASRELNRPSHQDRSKALYVLLWVAKKNNLLLREIKGLDETRLKQLASDSVLPTVKGPAQQLLAMIAEWDKGPIPSTPVGAGIAPPSNPLDGIVPPATNPGNSLPPIVPPGPGSGGGSGF